MEIRYAHIFGFGKWIDTDFDFSGGSYICVYGENESGKTTIQQFLMFMLFGFPPKRRSAFRPKQSGKMGGRLTLFDQDIGEFTIERVDGVRNGSAVCHIPDGETYGEEWLQNHLHGMTYGAYQSVFTFSALDLIALQHMKEEDLGEVLLGIGLTASANIHAIEKKLDNKIGELFKPSGRKPIINKQLQSLDELYASLQKDTNTEKTYREKQAIAHQLLTDINKLQEQVKEERLKLNRLERQQQALPVAHEFREEKKLLSVYSESIPFPEKGEARLSKLNSELLPLKSELSVLRGNEETYEEKLISLRSNLLDKQIYEKAGELLKQQPVFFEQKHTLTSLSASITKHEIQLEAELEQMEIGLSRSNLNGLTLPFHLENVWDQIKKDREEVDTEKERLERANQQLKANRDYLLEQRKAITNDLLSEQKRKEFENQINRHNEQYYMEKMKQEATRQQTGLETMRKKQQKQSRMLLFGSIAAAVVLFIMAVFNGESTLYVVGAFLALAGFLQWGLAKKPAAEMESITRDDLSFSAQITEHEKDEASRLLSLHEQKKNELTAIQDRLRNVDIEFLQWKERKRGLDQRENRLLEQVSLQLADYPFLKQVQIHYWPDLYNKLKAILNVYRDLNYLQQQYNELMDDRQNVNDQLNGFYHTMNWESANKSIETKFTEIEQLPENYKRELGILDQYEKWLKENREQQDHILQKMNVYQSEKQELLNIANAADEEEFLGTAKQLDRRQTHEANIRKQLSQLNTLLNPDELDVLLADEPLYQSDLEKCMEQVSERIAGLDEAINEKRQQYADINAELSGMESSESQSDIQHRFAIESEQLKKLAHEWSVYKSAKEMLKETKRNYREKYINHVLAKTESYFTRITGGYYHAVYPPSAAESFRVEAKDGLRYTAGELSKGTIDQLYVSLRLAIGEVMSEKHKLPFIIDDAFVHFDAVRIQQLVDILAEISTARQIIFFTCKQVVSKAADGIQIIELDNSVRIS
ncbi:ATP-binding protein [Virgibacillus ihumii]|uniref:ATP-binding protein n=1 Tax=Virgibacillus ihumii TaxID=2686091 RepID=UPI00157D968F|nr:AAA family ATPase [Virgibacillus ihumii]